MKNAPSTEPTSATANDTLTWQRSLPEYPPSEGWELSYALRGPASLDIDADSSTGNYSVTTPAPETPGDYLLQGYVTKGAQRFTIYTGTLAVSPDLSTVSGAYDARTPNKKILDAIDSVIAGRATRTELEYEYEAGGTRRKLKSIPLEDLARVRGVYAQKVWREQNPGSFAQGINVSFGGSY